MGTLDLSTLYKNNLKIGHTVCRYFPAAQDIPANRITIFCLPNGHLPDPTTRKKFTF